MELHHSRHHQAYVTNLNKALNDMDDAIRSHDLDRQITLQSAVNFNGGGHINHSLFWANLAPATSRDTIPAEAAKALSAAITKTWGSLEKYQAAFAAKLLALQGSGWGWLVKNPADGSLQIITTKDQDQVPSSFVPILGVDMWEHAYYLQVSNGPVGRNQPISARVSALTWRVRS